MPKRSNKRKEDAYQAATRIVRLSAEQSSAPAPNVKPKNPAAVALGKLAGAKRGKARAQSLSAERRKEIAQRATILWWSKEKS